MNSAIFSLWPIAPFGGEDPVDPPASNADGSQPDPVKNTNPDGTQKDSAATGEDGAGDDDDADDDKYAGYTAKELRRIAADKEKEAETAKKEAKRLKDKEDAEERKKNDDVTNLNKDLETERKTVSTLRATMTKQAIEGAIRDDSRFEWNDIEIVAGLLDPEVVKVSDEGKVEGLKPQLTKIAKDHQFLVKKDNSKDNGSGNGNGSGGPTGFQPGQGGASGGGKEVDTKTLVENWPALATRV